MEGNPSPDDGYTSLTIQDRLRHKNWKARVSAYEELAKTFKTTIDEDAPEFTPYLADEGAAMHAAILDANAVAQERGLECACALVEYGGKRAAVKVKDTVLTGLLEKGLWGASRAGTKKLATELCLLLVECEGTAATVLQNCLDGLSSKQPKAVAGAVAVMKEIVRQFGTTTVDVKPILSRIPTVLAHADKSVRSEGNLLVQELHRYLGDALEPYLIELKPVQLKELQDAFAREEKGIPTRLTRAQQKQRAVQDTEASLNGRPSTEASDAVPNRGSPEPIATTDPYEYAPAVAILDQLPRDFYDKLQSPKWKERKEEALDPLLQALRKTTKLVVADYEELVRALTGRMADANVACVISAANCLQHLAAGLRHDFARYKSICIAPILERCKEKKASVIDALAAALDALFIGLNISDISEEVATFAKHKNPQVKEQTLRFLIRSLSTTKMPPSVKTDLKPLSDCLMAGLEDSSEPVRAAAAEGLGTLRRILGERALAPLWASLDDVRKAKVMDYEAKAIVQCGPTSRITAKAALPSAKSETTASSAPVSTERTQGTAPDISKMPPRLAAAMRAKMAAIGNTNATPSRTPDTSISTDANKENAPVDSRTKIHSSTGSESAVKQRPSSEAPTVKRAPVLSSAASRKPPIASTAAVATPSHRPSPSEPLKYRYTQEDADSLAPSVVPAEILQGVSDSNWKIRNASMEALQAWITSGDGAGVDSELVVRVLSKKPGWKESNFQVYSKMCAIFQLLAQTSPTWSRACSALTIGPMSDKLGDVKLRGPVGETLTAYVEKFSLQFVLGQAYETMLKQKAPKTQADSLQWLDQQLRNFGVKGVAVRDLIEFLKVGLKSSNANVRTQALKALVTLRLFVGPDIKTFVQDLNANLLSTIDTEFTKANEETPPEPTRVSGDHASAANSGPSSIGAKGRRAGTDDPADELFPRQDLEKLVPSAMIASTKDANWKQRKEAMEGIQSILEHNKRLKPTLGELSAALKLRLTDSNKVVQGLALDIVSRIAKGMNQPFEKHARAFIPGIVAVLSDAKSGPRQSALVALTSIYESAGLECMLPSIATGLEPSNPLQRRELLTWVHERFCDRELPRHLPPELAALANPVITCIEDRNTEVRKAAQALLPFIIAGAGYQYVLDATSSLKPASRNTVLPLIEAARGAASGTSLSIQTEAPSALADAQQGVRQLSIDPPVHHSSASGPSSRQGLSRPPSATARILKPSGVASTLAKPTIARTNSPAKAAKATLSRPPSSTLPSSPSASRARSLQPSPSESTPGVTVNEAAGPPLISSDPQLKDNRARRETGPLRWSLEGPARSDQLTYLRQQMLPHISRQLGLLLFSNDHHSERDYIEGMRILAECADAEACAGAYPDIDFVGMKARIYANADLLFKYMSVRLADTSTTIVIKCLDLTAAIAAVFREDGRHCSDYEASIILPSLIAKLGDGKESVRSRTRHLLKDLGTIYPSSKIFSALLDHGLGSKSARTRAESAEDLDSLLQRQGMSVCTPAKALPAIASLIGDKDGACRSAALKCIATAASLVGLETVHAYIGRLPDKEQTMLDEKLKRSSAPAQGQSNDIERTATVRPESRNDLPNLGHSRLPAAASRRRVSGLPTADRAGTHVRATAAVPNTKRTFHARVEGVSHQESGTRLITSTSTSPERPDKLSVERILSRDPTESVEALKRIQHVISETPAELANDSDTIIETITSQMGLAFEGLDADTPQPTLRLCKHLMQTLSSFFDQPSLGNSVSRQRLVQLLGELTQRLLATADNAASDAIVSLSKVLNMVLIRIFHNANRSRCFGALFDILRESTVELRNLDGEALRKKAKYAELVMKCLWKVSKSIKESLEDNSLDAQQLLLDIDAFLQAIPPAEWRRRASDDVPLGDMPLRTVKTILQQVVALYGQSVYDQLALIDRPESSFVYQYLHRLLDNARLARVPAQAGLRGAAERQADSGSGGHIGAARTDSNGTGAKNTLSAPSKLELDAQKTTPRTSEIDMNLALRDIFDKIGNAKDSKSGIAELYHYQKAHPEADARIQTWIAATGSFFQSYLRRALSNLAAEDVAGDGAQSLSTSTGAVAPVGTSASAPLRRDEERLESLKQMFGVPRDRG